MWFWLLLACVDDAPSSQPSSPTPTVATGDTGDTAEAPTSGRFSVLTYNVQGLPDLLTGNDGAARMEGIAPYLPEYDVVGLQETFDETKHGLLVAESEHPIQDWSAETVDSTKAYGNGLGALVRGFEEVERESFFYSACHGFVDSSSDCLASKGLQRIRVRVPGTDALLDVYNTHHEAGGGDDDIAARDVQVAEVVAAMTAQGDEAAVLFVGDMNMHIDDVGDIEQLASYGDIGLRDACEEVDCPDRTHIDRIWVRDGTTMELVVEAWAEDERLYDAAGEPLSDHPPITAEVSWALP